MQAAHRELYGRPQSDGRPLFGRMTVYSHLSILILGKGCAIELTEAAADVKSTQSGAT